MPSIPIMILFDLVGWIFMCIELSIPLLYLNFAFRMVFESYGIVGLVLLSPLLLVTTLLMFCAGIFLLRRTVQLFLPRLKDGVFSFPNDPVARAWALNLQIARLPQMMGIRPFFMGSNLLRFFYLRALGSTASFRVNTSSDLYVYDAPMVEIQEEVMIGGSSGIAAHYIENGKLTLLKTVVGKGSQLMTGILLGPGCRLGERVKVASFTRLSANITVGARSYLGHTVIIEPNCTLGAKVIVGNRVTIESNCEIGERAVIASGAVVPKGTKIAAGGRYPSES
jgi:carbonic anhydrase/acetyltransferase-like protein (isoleucine patch superfamily)